MNVYIVSMTSVVLFPIPLILRFSFEPNTKSSVSVVTIASVVGIALWH